MHEMDRLLSNQNNHENLDDSPDNDFETVAGSLQAFAYESVGKVQGVDVEVRETIGGLGSRVKGMVVEVTDDDGSGSSYVEMDEIPELIQGFDAVLRLSRNPSKLKSFQFSYTSKDNLKVTVFNTQEGILRYSLEAGGRSGARANLLPKGLVQLKMLFDAAEKKLASL